MPNSDQPFVPFWATKQYAGGLVQGIGVGLFCLFLLNSVSATFFQRYVTAIGVIGLVMLILGGLQARRAR
jgi:hypothetical protein